MVPAEAQIKNRERRWNPISFGRRYVIVRYASPLNQLAAVLEKLTNEEYIVTAEIMLRCSARFLCDSSYDTTILANTIAQNGDNRATGF